MTHVLIDADVLREVREMVEIVSRIDGTGKRQAARDLLSRLPDEGLGEPDIGNWHVHGYDRTVLVHGLNPGNSISIPRDNAAAIAHAILALIAGPRDGGTDGN